MKFSAVLFVTTVLSAVRSDEVMAKDRTKTLAPTELLVPDVFSDFGTIAPSDFVTDDDWDPTFIDGDMGIDVIRMQRFLNENVTDTDELELRATVCSEDCKNAATNAMTSSVLGRFTTFLDGFGFEAKSFSVKQGPCGSCEDSNRFFRSLQDGGGGGGSSGATELVFIIKLEEAVAVTPELTEQFVAADTFIEVLDEIGTATKGIVSEPVFEVSTPSPTAAPSKAPTNAPDKRSKKSKQFKTKSNKKTRNPTRAPTKRPKTSKKGKKSKRI